MKLCPQCSTKRLNSAVRCDCGYSFQDDSAAPAPSGTMTRMKKCTYCGKEYPDDATSCPTHGQTLITITPRRSAENSALRPPSSARKRRITHISIHQTSKVLTLLYVVIGIIFIPVGVLMILAGQMTLGLIYVLMPFIYGIIGYPLHAGIFWVYNALAKSVGGVEFTVEDKNDGA